MLGNLQKCLVLWTGLLTQLRKVGFVADWLALRTARRESRELVARHRKGLEEAKKRNVTPQAAPLHD